MDRATDAYNRAKQVYDKGSLPEVKWIEVQTQLNQARSLCDIAKKNLADCSLTAPLSATVEKRYVEPGTTVSPMQPVVRLVDISNLYVRMSVPEADIASIAIGDSVRVSVNAADSVTLLGIIKEKDISADAISHSYLVRARLIATREQMRSILPGMVCRVKIDSPLPPQNAGAQQLLVPNRAVQIDNNGQRFVWVVTEDSTAVRRPVVIGDLTARGVLIIDGLSQGDIIVTDGTQKIASGTKVSF